MQTIGRLWGSDSGEIFPAGEVNGWEGGKISGTPARAAMVTQMRGGVDGSGMEGNGGK